MNTLSKATLALYAAGHRLYSRARGRLEERSEHGAEVIGWIMVVIAVIAIALFIVAAVNGFGQRKVSELGN
jgi:hypothetical protein